MDRAGGAQDIPVRHLKRPQGSRIRVFAMVPDVSVGLAQPMQCCSREMSAIPKKPNPLQEDSGIVRVPYEAISRPLADRRKDALNSGFLSEQRLADLLFRRQIRRAGRGRLICDGKVYELHEAVQILGPEHNRSDPYGLSGVVEHLSELRRAGASIGPKTMHLGSATYQVVRGVIAVACADGAAALAG